MATGLDFELEFTRLHKECIDMPPALREAKCLAIMFPRLLDPIDPGDIITGRITYGLVGFSPEPGGLGYFCNTEAIASKLSHGGFDPETVVEAEELLAYWQTGTTTHKVMSSYPPHVSQALKNEDWSVTPMVASALYRMAGSYLDYGKLVELGVPGLRTLVQDRLGSVADSTADADLFHGMLMALDTLVDCIRHYGNEARRLADAHAGTYPEANLRGMAETLDAIAHRAPASLREAMQLIWIYSIVSGSINHGRLDTVLGDFLAADLADGRLTDEGAQELFNGFWRIIADRKTTWNGRVVIGGRGRRNEANADKAAIMAMEASRVVKAIEPQLTLRIYEGMNPDLLEKAYSVIGEGRTYPMLYNDDTNIPAVREAFGVGIDEAEQYVPFGCGEYVIDHRSFGTPNGIINLLKALEAALHNGRDSITGRLIGPETGDPTGFKTFDDLLRAYKGQVEYFIAALAEQETIEYKVCGEEAPFLYLSMLYDDCVSRGKGIFNGGVRYLGGTVETYGNINTSDSLTAIREAVYEKGLVSLEELIRALDSDFIGYENLRKQLQTLPKYGNDDETADSMAVLVHEHVCNSAREQAARVGLASYLVVIINNSANTTLGGLTAASADGRGKGIHMANANNPWGGNDRNGLTSMLNSLLKLRPDIHAGAVQNMKFTPTLFNSQEGHVKNLLKAYFDNGGTQAMISVVGREDMINAIAKPREYGHLFVRVGGFSARFVELNPLVQQEILSRTHY